MAPPDGRKPPPAGERDDPAAALGESGVSRPPLDRGGFLLPLFAPSSPRLPPCWGQPVFPGSFSTGRISFSPSPSAVVLRATGVSRPPLCIIQKRVAPGPFRMSGRIRFPFPRSTTLPACRRPQQSRGPTYVGHHIIGRSPGPVKKKRRDVNTPPAQGGDENRFIEGRVVVS